MHIEFRTDTDRLTIVIINVKKLTTIPCTVVFRRIDIQTSLFKIFVAFVKT